jgi:hypothetical protein
MVYSLCKVHAAPQTEREQRRHGPSKRAWRAAPPGPSDAAPTALARPASAGPGRRRT